MSYKIIFLFALICFESSVYGTPVSREQMTFRLWTRDQKGFKPLFYGQLGKQNVIKNDKDFKFIIHGWHSNVNDEWFYDVKNEYLKKKDCNVITVDWSGPASDGYIATLGYTKDVGNILGDFIIDLNNTLNVSLERIHLIGHSLGAHVSGFAGKYVQKNGNGRIGRITGLDPAGPVFALLEKDDRLSDKDASFVDVIHTHAGINGLTAAVGHVDFYPNGGSSQPGCPIIFDISCSHGRAFEFFTESINSMGFVARECDNFWKYELGFCNHNNMTVMGDNTPTNTRGIYYLSTNAEPPFAMN